MSGAAFLDVQGLTQRFGGIVAVEDVSLRVAAGEVFGLIGPNGAGKTTLLNCICGVYVPQEGRVILDGLDLTGKRPHKVMAAGVARTLQAADFFAGMSVLDFLRLSRLEQQVTSLTLCILSLPKVRRSERAERDRAMAMLKRLGLEHLADHELGALPYGVRKLLDVGRALMTEPRLLLMDEPTSGTSLSDREALRQVVGELRAEGITTVIVDHDVAFIAAVSDRLLAINFGRALGEGAPEEVLRRPDVLEAYVGLEDEAGSGTAADAGRRS
jgi:branched-chain amino acid transport system ATP-binding protein